MWAIELLQKTPTIVWGAIIGSLTTLLGTWFQGRNTFRMFLQKEETDRKNAKEQRNFDLRKNEYLTALSAIAELNNLLTDFTNPGYKYEDFGKKTQIILKDLLSIDIIADVKTLEPIHKFQQFYLQCSFELMNLKIPLEMLVTDQGIAQNSYDFFSNKISETIERMKQSPYTDPPDNQRYFHLLNEQYTEYCKERDMCSDKLNKLRNQILDLNFDLKRRVFDKLATIQLYISEFISYARKDLGLSSLSVNENSIQAYYKSVNEYLTSTYKNVIELTQRNKGNAEDARDKT